MNFMHVPTKNLFTSSSNQGINAFASLVIGEGMVLTPRSDGVLASRGVTWRSLVNF